MALLYLLVALCPQMVSHQLIFLTVFNYNVFNLTKNKFRFHLETKNILELAAFGHLKKEIVSRIYKSFLKDQFKELIPRFQSNWAMDLGEISREESRLRFYAHPINFFIQQFS